MAEMDRAAVAAAGGVDSPPTDGHLLFFFTGWSAAGSSGRQAWDHGRVIYRPAGTPRRPRPCPDPDPAESEQPIEEPALPARLVGTPPSTSSEMVEHDFGAEAGRQPVRATWTRAFWRRPGSGCCCCRRPGTRET